MKNLRLLFFIRCLRMLSFGLVSVILVFFLSSIGMSVVAIGLLLSLTLVGDTVLSLCISLVADRIGRRRMLVLASMLMVFAGLAFMASDNFWFLLLAATIGVISPSGNESGPFLAIEQAAVAELVPQVKRTSFFAWYNLGASFSTAAGALAGGWIAELLHQQNVGETSAYRYIFIAYVGIAVIMMVLTILLGTEVETKSTRDTRLSRSSRFSFRQLLSSRLGLHTSKGMVLKLAALFSLDAFAGGMVMQSLLAYWLHLRFGADTAVLGTIFFIANILAGFSALCAGALAKRIGLINTMVFTHIPSNVLLMLIPFMPSLEWAIALLLMRFAISQMDVPTRQAYTMAVVEPDERSAAAGITGMARTTGSSLSPLIQGLMTPAMLFGGVALMVAGGLKIVYDVLLYFSFKAHERKG